jgi:hypothetical protein
MIDALFFVNRKFNTRLAARDASENSCFALWTPVSFVVETFFTTGGTGVHRENPHREKPRHVLVAVAAD